MINHSLITYYKNQYYEEYQVTTKSGYHRNDPKKL